MSLRRGSYKLFLDLPFPAIFVPVVPVVYLERAWSRLSSNNLKFKDSR